MRLPLVEQVWLASRSAFQEHTGWIEEPALAERHRKTIVGREYGGGPGTASGASEAKWPGKAGLRLFVISARGAYSRPCSFFSWQAMQ